MLSVDPKLIASMLLEGWQTHDTLPLGLDTAHQTLAAFLSSTNLARLATNQALRRWRLGGGRRLGKRWQTHQTLPFGLDTTNQTLATLFSSTDLARLATRQTGWFRGCRGCSGQSYTSRLLFVGNLALGTNLARTTERCRHGAFRTRGALSRTGFVFERCWGATLAIEASWTSGSLLAWSGWEDTCRFLLVRFAASLASDALYSATDRDRAIRARRTLNCSSLRAESPGRATLAIPATFSRKPRKACSWWNTASRGVVVWNERLLTLAAVLQPSTGSNETWFTLATVVATESRASSRTGFNRVLRRGGSGRCFGRRGCLQRR